MYIGAKHQWRKKYVSIYAFIFPRRCNEIVCDGIQELQREVHMYSGCAAVWSHRRTGNQAFCPLCPSFPCPSVGLKPTQKAEQVQHEPSTDRFPRARFSRAPYKEEENRQKVCSVECRAPPPTEKCLLS